MEHFRMRKNIERQNRQDFITGVARRLLAEQGIENTNLNDIAKASEYTRRTLYSYFKGREDILLRVFTQDLRERWESQKSALAGIEGGELQLRKWSWAYFDYAKANPSSLKLQFYMDYHGVDPRSTDPETFAKFQELNDELGNHLRQVLKQGILEGAFQESINLDVCVSNFVYSLRSILHRAFAESYSFVQINAQEYFENYLNIFISGLGTNNKNKADK